MAILIDVSTCMLSSHDVSRWKSVYLDVSSFYWFSGCVKICTHQMSFRRHDRTVARQES